MNDESIDFADSRMDVSFFLSSFSDFANFDEEDFFLEDFVFVSTEASSALREEEAADPPFPNIATRLGRTPRPAAVTPPPVKEEADPPFATANATMAVAHTAPTAPPYALILLEDDFLTTGLTRPPPSSDDEESPNRVCVSPLILELVVLVLLLVVVFMMINALSFSLLHSLSLKICDRISRVGLERYEHRSFRGFRY
jgi:hypothetical protein